VICIVLSDIANMNIQSRDRELMNEEGTMKRNESQFVPLFFVASIFVLASGCSSKLIYKKTGYFTPPLYFNVTLNAENGLIYSIGDWNDRCEVKLTAFFPDDGSVVWNIGNSDSCYSHHPRSITIKNV
jgi:hypothetical protein